MPRTHQAPSKSVTQARRSLSNKASQAGHSLLDHAKTVGTHAQAWAQRAQASTSQGASRAKESVKAHPVMAVAATAAIGGLVAYLMKRHRRQ